MGFESLKPLAEKNIPEYAGFYWYSRQFLCALNGFMYEQTQKIPGLPVADVKGGNAEQVLF